MFSPKRLLRYSGIALLIAATVFIIFFLSVLAGIFGHVPSTEELREYTNESASMVYSADGKLIGKFYHQNRTNVLFDELPGYLIDALVATEDHRFFIHEGIDSRSFLRVIIKTIMLGDESSGGGSTITQQLAKNVLGRDYKGLLSLPANKIKESVTAHRIEKVYSKEDVLTLYFNTVPFGENIYGIGAASRRYFNKEPLELSLTESATLVGMLKANTTYNPRLYPEKAIERRNTVISKMHKHAFLNKSARDSLMALPLELDYHNVNAESPAPYFLERVRRHTMTILDSVNNATGSGWDADTDGLIIHTTLNTDLQLAAVWSMKKHLGIMQPRLRDQYRKGSERRRIRSLIEKERAKADPEKKDGTMKLRLLFGPDGLYTDSISISDSILHALTTLHAGIIAVNPQNGHILAWTGGIDHRIFPYDQILARRQLASTIKPFIYLTAFESGIKPCEYLSNKQVTFSEFDNWTPENYDQSTGGKYSASAALARSMNIPTVDLYLKIDQGKLSDTWKRAGFLQELPATPAVSLGAVDASLSELAFAYAAFANGGYNIDPVLITSVIAPDGDTIWSQPVRKKERVFRSIPIIFINQILQKAVHSGTGAALRSRFGVRHPMAGKTGTSQNYSDAWFVAYNPGIVIATRAGTSSPDIHFNNASYGSGSSLALPLAGYMLNKIAGKRGLRYMGTQFPEVPEYIERQLLCSDVKKEIRLPDFFRPDPDERNIRKKERQIRKEQNRKKRKKTLNSILEKFRKN